MDFCPRRIVANAGTVPAIANTDSAMRGATGGGGRVRGTDGTLTYTAEGATFLYRLA